MKREDLHILRRHLEWLKGYTDGCAESSKKAGESLKIVMKEIRRRKSRV